VVKINNTIIRDKICQGKPFFTPYAALYGGYQAEQAWSKRRLFVVEFIERQDIVDSVTLTSIWSLSNWHYFL